MPIQLSVIGKVLESDKVCANHKNILHSAFGLYMTNIDYLDNYTSVFLDDNLIDKFYNIHNINYDTCLKKYATLPRNINSEKSKVITEKFIKDSFLKLNESLVKSNIDKLIDYILDRDMMFHHMDSNGYSLGFSDNFYEDNQSFTIPKEYIPIIKNLLNKLTKKIELAQVPTIFIDSINEFYIKYQEEIITHKLDKDFAIYSLIQIIKIKLNNLKAYQRDTCYLLFTLQETTKYSDELKPLKDFLKDIDLKKCEKDKQNFIIDKDLFLYLIFKKTDLFEKLSKKYRDLNISISTPINILENKILENSQFKLLNLLSLSFYSKYNSSELQDIIELYQEQYDKDLVNNILIYSLLMHKKIPLKIMTKLIANIDFKIGKHTYFIPLEHKTQLGEIVKLSYIPTFYKSRDKQKVLFGLNYKSSMAMETNGYFGLNEYSVSGGFTTSISKNDTLFLSSYISGDIKELLLKKAIERSTELYRNGSLPNYFIANLSPKYSKLDIADELYKLAHEHSKEQNTTNKASYEYREAQRLYIDDNISKNIKQIGHIDFELGLLFLKNKKYIKALVKFEKALNTYQRIDNKKIYKKRFMAHTYHFIAKTNFNLQDYNKTKKAYISSISLYIEARKIDKYIQKDRLGHVYFELGNLYFNQFKKYRNSIDKYQQSIAFYEKLKNNSNKIRWIANAYRNSAKAYLRLKMNKKTIREYFKLIKLYQKVKNQNLKYYNKQIGYELFDLGNIYFDMKKYKNAQKVYYKSMTYIKDKEEKFNFSKVQTIANLHRNIAHTYKLLGEFEKAIFEYKKALAMYEKLNNTYKDRFKKDIFNAKDNLSFLYKKVEDK